MISSNNIDHAIDSNKQIYQKLQVAKGQSNRAMMLSAYQTDKVQYYNDEKAKKKEDKKKKNKIATLIFTGVSSIAIVTGVVLSFIKGKKNNHIDASKLKDMGFDLKKLGFDTEKIKKSKAYTFISKKLDPLIKACINFGSIRDDFARRLVEKTKGTKFEFIDKGANKLTRQYHKWAHDGAKEGYEVARNNLLAALQKHGESRKIADFDSFFNDARNRTTTAFTKGRALTEEFFARDKDGKMRPLKEMGKEFTEDIIAYKRIKPIYDQYLIEDLSDDLLEHDDVRKALGDYNKIVQEVIDKHRDTNMGNAISDAAGMAAALGVLGVTVGTADGKEEKKSTILNLGFPIISTLAFMIYGNVRNISGAASMVFGFAFGEVAKMAAKLIDKVTSPKQKENVKA